MRVVPRHDVSKTPRIFKTATIIVGQSSTGTDGASGAGGAKIPPSTASSECELQRLLRELLAFRTVKGLYVVSKIKVAQLPDKIRVEKQTVAIRNAMKKESDSKHVYQALDHTQGTL